jgi:hypothetical protein
MIDEHDNVSQFEPKPLDKNNCLVPATTVAVVLSELWHAWFLISIALLTLPHLALPS